MSFEDLDAEKLSAIEIAKRSDIISHARGAIVRGDTPIPEYDNHRFISSTEYLNKYIHFLPDSFTERSIAPACRKWHERADLPADQRIGLISEKRIVAETAGCTRNGKPVAYKNRKRWQWFVFDIPPQDHPGWAAYHSAYLDASKRAGRYINKKFKEFAPIYLERFDEARKGLDQTKFMIKELSKMIGATVPVIRSWTEVGVEGFGKLPMLRASDKIKPLKLEDGSYACEVHTAKTKIGRIDYYFATKDIRRFLKGELADPKKQFHTIDDATEQTNIDEIASESGFFVYDVNKVAPPTYEGFMKWALENIVFYDRKTRRKTPFRPNEKQKELYRNAFKIGRNGNFQHKIIGICRPRGDYKTFDLALLVLFRFFNMWQERIYLVTNSVQQTSHIIYREIAQIIRNSPTLSDLLNTPALDIQKDGIYLRTGRGVENVFSAIELVSAEGGARSNATCIAWSEAWRYNGDIINVAELEQSIRGVENSWFLVESTVAPKGHFFYNYYQDSLTNENPILYFQYYDGSQRQNPRIDADYVNHVKRNWPIHYKMFFDNKWEDAVIGLFSEERIIEMGALGVDGGIGRNSELVAVTNQIGELNRLIRKYESGIDISHLIAQRNELIRRLTPVSKVYTHPATETTLQELGEIYNCEFVVGIGIDRSKVLRNRTDRTVLATVARGVLDSSQWGTDRIFFLLDLYVMAELSFDKIMDYIQEMANKFGGGFIYVDIEDYNAVDVYKTCEKLYGKDAAYIAPVSLRHQTIIFDELRMASENGYLKIPEIDIWFDEDEKVHYTKPPQNKQDILRAELSVFEAHAGTGLPGKGREGWFGSPTKKHTGRVHVGEPKDDCVDALAHACHAAVRGEIPAITAAPLLMDIYKNKDVVGTW